MCTRVKYRLSRRSTGSPIFGDLRCRHRAELVQQFLVRETSERFFVENGYLLPFRWLV